MQQIKRALISVSDKSGLEQLASFLIEHDVEVLSTGGTSKTLRGYGVNVTDVADYTGSPEIMDGRVKTLHPKVHGGILACLDDEVHVSQMQEHGINGIDLVIVNLYPFVQTVASGADAETIIENIDIGGPSMVRSAAKNHQFTAIITDPKDYITLEKEMKIHNGATSLEFRRKMAAKAFAATAEYDAAISSWFAKEQGEEFPPVLQLGLKRKSTLRYGENPHQKAGFYIDDYREGIASAAQIQGKELSYNNIHDASSAMEIVSEFDKAAVVFVKHANPCGAATGNTLAEAYDKALASDPVSAFGGIIALNRTLDKACAEKIASMFFEAVIAPDIDEDARSILAVKKNMRVLLDPTIAESYQGFSIKSVGGSYLVQDSDHAKIRKEDLKTVTERQPTDAELDDLLFAFSVCKHVRSNAIVLAKDKATIGIGAGQMSRVDASRIAAMKAADCTENPKRAEGSVLASDAFFPFADGVEHAAAAGVKAIIQPGGSIRDEEVIEAANKAGIAMVFTGMRHFKH